MPVYFLEILVVVLGVLLLLIDAFAPLKDKRALSWLGLVGLGVIFVLLFGVDTTAGESSFWDFYAVDGTSLFFKGLAIVTTMAVMVMGSDFAHVVVRQTAAPEEGAHPQAGLGEFYALPLFTCAGLMWMASAKNLVGIFVSLELVTISFYVLVAYLRRNVGSLEAGVKYLILGALSTGFLVYGFAWLFGITNTMDLAEIRAALSSETVNETGALFAFALILAAMAFKVGAAPFHMWIPDVYQGAPTPITAFLSVGSKAAGFIVLVRLAEPFLVSPILSEQAVLVFTVLAVLTLIVGNFSALPQKNFKRLLAYSSVAHAGFLLTALACWRPEAGSTVSSMQVIGFYLAAYLLMTLASFLALTAIRKANESESFDSFVGLAKRSPFLAFSLLLAMASLAGIPLTAGFIGKFMVFQLALAQGSYILLIVAIIAAALGFYYYLKIAISMYVEEPGKKADLSAIRVSPLTAIALVTLLALIIVAGVQPNLIFALMG